MTTSKIQKEIDRRNVIWKASSKREKAVLVAQDVLARLKSGKFTAESGRWLEFEDINMKEAPVQECILRGEECRGCAMGGLMMGLIAWRNKVKFSDISGQYDDIYGFGLGDDAFKYGFGLGDDAFKLSEIFSPSQQALIESTFEGGDGEFGHEWNDYEVECDKDCEDSTLQEVLKLAKKGDAQNIKSLLFYKRYPDDKDRLRAIMNNIVKNNGVFVP